MRILIVEDETDLCDTIAEGLQIDGYAVDRCYNGEEAYELIDTEAYDLVVLDLNLPGMDGIDILTEIRKQNTALKILILSARGSVSDKVLGLDTGANDYLAKPFDFEELEARIRSLSIDGRELSVTKKELALMEYFLLHPGHVISQEELMEHVWNMEADSFSNAVRVHIASLRKKLKSALDYDPIGTKIGEGYFLNEGDALC